MLKPLLRGEAGAAGWVCALAGAALPRRVHRWRLGWWRKHLALKLAGVVGTRKHSCRRVREPRELPPFVSLIPSHTRRCTWRGGKRVECLANFESASQSAAHPLHPAALASVPSGKVLVRVRVHRARRLIPAGPAGLDKQLDNNKPTTTPQPLMCWK